MSSPSSTPLLRGRPARAAQTLLVPGSRMLVVALFALLGLSATEHRAEAQVWSLTKAQRLAYLSYYAPVILKRGDENNDQDGHDWISNFDFDQDNNFSTNRENWIRVEHYVAASALRDTASPYSRWRIRPTLYTALVEYMEGSSKSLVLLYHVYNAADKDGDAIHDWERIEIVVRGVGGTPGAAGEYVNTVTVTLHDEHIMRRYYDSGINFMQTATGKHVLLWQADLSRADFPNYSATHAHELRFVLNSYSWIASQMSTGGQAEVNINDKDEKKNVHYVFVPEGSSSAVSTWGAKPLNYTTASTLKSGVDNETTVYWPQAKRIQYELQDIADILPTHWSQNSTWSRHWLSDEARDVLLESPITNETGLSEVSSGMQLFYARSRDIGSSSLTDDRNGYPAKGWLFGVYGADLNADGSDEDFPGYQGSGIDSYGRSRGAASGYYASHGAYWWQHDYFVHSGAINTSSSVEGGMWLVGPWYTAASGGFDGRWVQLFDDRPGYDPLALSVAVGPLCVTPRNVTATVSGGQQPYTVTWTNATPVSSRSDPINRAQAYAGTQVSVTVRDAIGMSRSASLTIPTTCTERDPTGGNR